jgi:hypothetical protein
MTNKLMRVFGRLAVLIIMSATVLALAGKNQEFSISAFPSVATTRPSGPSVKYTVALASYNGFSGRVFLTCQPDSPSATCSVTPSSVRLNPELAVSATVTAGAPGNAKSGSYRLRITGNSGGDHQSTAVTLIVR